MNALEPGSTLGGYRILARLRAGAMGVLYLARRSGASGGFSRAVAIKVIHDHLSQNKRFVRMFVDEAKLSARIEDPNVVRVEEFGEEGGRHYLVMEYVHGVSLAQAIGVLRRRGGIPIEAAVAIAIQIAGGLHAAHEATNDDGTPLGIVHRDVSPHNVIVSYRGHVRVIDFGIAKAQQVGGQTKTGSLRGKLAYMPPEQARSARTVDRRADLYGVGLVLWEMLTLRRVFDADTDIAILNQIREPNIRPPSAIAPKVPKALDDVVMQVLAQDPDARPATGLLLQRALGEALPEALRLMPADLAALMTKVRNAAAAMGAEEDPSALYGEEIRRALTLVGEKGDGPPSSGRPAPSSRRPAPESDDAIDTKPGRAAGDFIPQDVTAAMPGPVVVDEETLKRRSAARPSSAGVLPSDGVRPIAPEVVVPPPLSSGALDARQSSPEMMAHLARLSSPDPAMPTAIGPAAPQATTLRQKIMIAVAVPIVAVLVVGFAVIAGGAPEATTAAAPRRRDASADVASPALIAPIVIAPPIDDDEPLSSAAPSASLSPRAAAILERARTAALEGRANDVRTLLERKVRAGHGTPEEMRLVKNACQALADVACVEDVNRLRSR
ncbi:MAG: protein kinase [Labilithrix sp.]|nr:protein kinase [Labilithrix sp.]